MTSFRDEFATKFGSTKRVRKLTRQFEDVKPDEFKRIKKKMERFKIKKLQL